MNTFFRTAVYMCFLLIIFTLILNLVESTGAFPMTTDMGVMVDDSENALQRFTGLTGGMEWIWLTVTSLGAGLALGVSYITRTIIPLGIFLFGEVFWTSWIRANSVLSFGGYMPMEFTVIFLVATMFVFIAAVIGMITGSG